MKPIPHTSRLALSVLIASLCGPAGAQAPRMAASVPAAAAPSEPALSEFRPRPSTTTRLDYSVWDDALQEFVLYGGPSLRKRERRPEPSMGSRIVHGHVSPLRLEGNKLAMEYFSDDFHDAVGAYAADLIAIGNRLDIPALPRNEQLSYWLNLHNVLIVNAIADAYPVKHPSRITGADGRELHDTTLAVIDGVPLSLRDIRERIVYPHWNDRRVIYGFFLGDLGSPALQRQAYNGKDVWRTLQVSADEFATSLRGFERRGDTLRVSRVYRDVARFYFPDFEPDLRAHLLEHANETTREELGRAAEGTIRVAIYEDTIADLTAGDGDREPLSWTVSTTQRPGASGADAFRNDNGQARPSSVVGRLLQEQRRKFQRLYKEGLIGTVFIEDINLGADAERDMPDNASASPP